MDHQQNMSGFTNSFFFGGRSVMEMQCFLGGVLTGNEGKNQIHAVSLISTHAHYAK